MHWYCLVASRWMRGGKLLKRDQNRGVARLLIAIAGMLWFDRPRNQRELHLPERRAYPLQRLRQSPGPFVLRPGLHPLGKLEEVPSREFLNSCFDFLDRCHENNLSRAPAVATSAGHPVPELTTRSAPAVSRPSAPVLYVATLLDVRTGAVPPVGLQPSRPDGPDRSFPVSRRLPSVRSDRPFSGRQSLSRTASSSE